VERERGLAAACILEALGRTEFETDEEEAHAFTGALILADMATDQRESRKILEAIAKGLANMR